MVEGGRRQLPCHQRVCVSVLACVCVYACVCMCVHVWVHVCVCVLRCDWVCIMSVGFGWRGPYGPYLEGVAVPSKLGLLVARKDAGGLGVVVGVAVLLWVVLNVQSLAVGDGPVDLPVGKGLREGARVSAGWSGKVVGIDQ
jgi:hypothetical protein